MILQNTGRSRISNNQFIPQIDSALMGLANAFQNKTRQDEQNALATAYARNPAYMQAELGLQGANIDERKMRMAEMQFEREQARKDALRKLASGIGTGGFNPNAQQPLSALDLIRQEAMITGDLSNLNSYNLQLAKQQGGIDTPASIRLADEIRKARDSGDIQRVNDLIASAKLYDKGLQYNERGEFIPVTGYGEALGALGGKQKYGTEMGGLQAELEMNPQIEMATKEAAEVGKNVGEARAEYADLSAAYPQLIDTTDRLSRLAQVATYSKAGRLSDAFKRQLGVEVGTPAEAAAEMATTIDVEVLPLLKPTFGAAFTVNEGEWLRNTMGNPDLSPEEKIKQIQARVRGWNNRVKTLENRLNVPEQERLGIVDPNIGARTDPREAARQEAIRRGLIKQ